MTDASLRILVCNVGWMNRYQGLAETSDGITGGGAYPTLYKNGGEVCNFSPGDDGFVYGHVETIKGTFDRKLDLNKLGGTASSDFVDGVEVIWVSTHPKEGRRRVIGWYQNARVYRERQEFGDWPSVQHEKDGIGTFRIRAYAEDALLLPEAERDIELKRGPGWIGQANWWYPDHNNPEVSEFLIQTSLKLNGNQRLNETPLKLREKRRYVIHQRIERRADHSNAVKNHHGYKCQACSFDFEAKYGEVGRSFIEAHHLRPLSTLEIDVVVEYDLDQDFAVLCANCHRMIHRMPDPSDLPAFRTIIKSPAC